MKRGTLQSGFTLVELLVVVFILGLLAALVAPNLIGAGTKQNPKIAKTQIEMLRTALDSFRLDVGRYPNSQEGLQALLERPAGVERWDGPYLREGKGVCIEVRGKGGLLICFRMERMVLPVVMG